MPRTRYTLALLLLALAGPALRAQAVPTTLSYQGVLTDAAGTPVPDGTYAVALRLFTAASGGSATYAENHTVSTVGGVFSAELGAGTPVTGTWAGVAFDQGYWLETAVGGTTLAPRTRLLAGPYARALTLPYAASASQAGSLLHLTNTGGSGIRGETSTATGAGVWGEATSATGVSYGGFFRASSTSAQAVFAQATAASGTTYGVYGTASSPQGRGVVGVGGTYGGHFTTGGSTGAGVYGEATATTGTTYGGYFRSASTGGRAVYAQGTATTGTTYGVYATTPSTSGRGVYGEAVATSGTTYGGYFTSAGTTARGVFATATSATGTTYGVRATASSTSGTGVYGAASATSGETTGGYFTVNSADGSGVFGWNTSTATLSVPSAFGVEGRSDAEFGVGVYGEGTHAGVAYGVYGRAPLVGVRGMSTYTSGPGYGGYFSTDSPDGYAGYFVGDVGVTGTLSKAGGSFQIDHPLDPENRILRHSFVESPDMMNVYNGNVTTDARGYATVTLPDYFGALNRDFRYQLTTIGSFARAMVAEEVTGNRFVIRTEEPNVRVSWQVTGIRQDAWANENRIVVEEDKKPEHRGRYFAPEAHGQPRERGVDYDPVLEAEPARRTGERARPEATQDE